MKSDKEVKKEFKLVASQNPDKYYPTSFLKKELPRLEKVNIEEKYAK